MTGTGDTLNLVLQNAAGTAAGTAQQITITPIAADNAVVSAQIGATVYTGGTTDGSGTIAEAAALIKTLLESFYGASATVAITGTGDTSKVVVTGKTVGQVLDITNVKIGSTALVLAPANANIAAVNPTLTITPTVVDGAEIINLDNTTGFNVNADASKWVGAQQIWNNSTTTTGDVTLTNVAVGTALGIAGKGDTTATFKEGLSTSPLTNGTVTLAINGAGTSTSARSAYDLTANTNNTFKTLTVNASGTTNFVSVVGSAVTSTTTLKVTGAGKVDLTGAAATTLDNVTILDASANTGGVTVALQGNEKNVTITGGSGNDVFDMDDHLTKLDVINGGEGTNTVRVSDVSLTSATAATIEGINATTNIQKFAMRGATATLDASKVTVLSSFEFATSGTGATGNAVVVSGLANTDVVAITNAVTGAAGSTSVGGKALTFTPGTDSASNILNLSVKGNVTGGIGDGGSNIGGAALDAGLFETVNLAVNADTTFRGGFTAGTTTVSGASVIVADNASINVTGGAFSLNMGTITGLNTTVNASALGGALTVTGDSGINVITGGAGNDLINGANGRDTINLGVGGNDIVILATTIASRDVVTGFTAGTDSNTADQFNVGTYTGLTEFKVTGVSYTWGDDKVIEYSFEAANNSADLSKATDGTELFKAIANQGSSATVAVAGATDKGYVTAYQGGKAYIYYFDGGNVDTSITADEVLLVATVDAISVGSFVAGNFIA